MDELSYKIRISVLWLLAIVAFFGYRTLAVSEDAKNVSLLENQDFASYLLVMMAFAFLSLILPIRLNRLMNMIAGGLIMVLQLIMLVDGASGYPSETFNAMTGVTVVATASIVWLAVRWPRAARELRNDRSGIEIEERAAAPHAA
jgi:hypothetical protein